MIRRLRYWLKKRLYWVTVPVSKGPLKGSKFGLFTSSKYVRGTYEPNEVASFLRFIKKGDTVLDVGAHAGYYSLLAANQVGERGKVIAIEPHPLNLAYLWNHFKINNVQNATILDCAIGSMNQWVSFDTSAGTGRAQVEQTFSKSSELIEMKTLDSLFERGLVGKPKVIKMDIEGAELEALKGARTLIRSSQPAFVLSTHGHTTKAKCIQFLAEQGYRISLLGDDCISAEFSSEVVTAKSRLVGTPGNHHSQLWKPKSAMEVSC